MSNYQHMPLIMGVLNVTPDSFYDGGHYFNHEQAYQHARTLIQQGADFIDIGGESTRPGAMPISVDEELTRVIPVIERIRANHNIRISIDTRNAMVMQAAVAAGATLINDINALQGRDALTTAAALKVPVCLMHMQGEPATMQIQPQYAHGIIEEINEFFQQRITACLAAGIARENLYLDPGFGFGKTVRHNLLLMKRLMEFQCHGLPLMIGVSRKSTIGTVLQKPPEERLSGGLALTVLAALNGVSIVRTHDVAETKQALQMVDAVITAQSEESKNILKGE